MIALMSPQDLDWLFEIHLGTAPGRSTTVVAVLYGNEDAPSAVDLHDVDHYAAPYRRYVADDDGILRYVGTLVDVTRKDNRPR